MFGTNTLREFGLRARVDHVRTGAQHGNGRAAGVHRGLVRCAIDALGQPAGDGESRCRERASKGLCGRDAALTGIATANDRDLRHP